jgi:HAMP domain-containing protein
MKVLNESINELKKEVKSLRQDVSKGKGAVSVLVFIGTIIAGIVGYFAWDG